MREPTPAERRAALEQPGALDALRAEREAAVVAWRSYVGGETLHRPEPLLAEQSGRHPGRWCAEGEEPPEGKRCGFDAEGRIVIVQGWFPGQRREELLSYGPRHVELVLPGWSDGDGAIVEVRHVTLGQDGRVLAVHDDEGHVERHRYDEHGRLEEITEVINLDAGRAIHTRVEYDANGALARVVFDNEEHATTVWDAVIHLREEQLPPLPQIVDGLARGLARAAARAIAAAAAELDEPRLVALHLGDHCDPLSGTVMGASYLADMRRHGGERDTAIRHADEAARAGEQARLLDLVHHADADTQRRLRQLRQRGEEAMGAAYLDAEGTFHRRRRGGDDTRSLMRVQLALVRESYRLLVASGEVTLPIVLHGDREPRGDDGWSESGRDERDWATTLLTLGRSVVEQLWSELTSAREPAQEQREEPVEATRAWLRGAVRSVGLDRVEEAVLADSSIGIGLVPDPAGPIRIGGGLELPPGSAWPLHDGHAMTPLAVVDCAALSSEADDRALLPQDGTLVLLADLGVEDRIGWADRTADEGWFAVLQLPAGTAVEPLEPPAELFARDEWHTGLLPASRARAVPVLTLPAGWGAPEGWALTSGEQLAYERLSDRLYQVRGEVEAQLLGHPLTVQDMDPREGSGQRLLFQLRSGHAFGFSLMDGGTIMFVLDAEDLRARRWDGLVVHCDTA